MEVINQGRTVRGWLRTPRYAIPEDRSGQTHSSVELLLCRAAGRPVEIVYVTLATLLPSAPRGVPSLASAFRSCQQLVVGRLRAWLLKSPEGLRRRQIRLRQDVLTHAPPSITRGDETTTESDR